MRRALAVWSLRERTRGATLVARRGMEGDSDDDEDMEDAERRMNQRS